MPRASSASPALPQLLYFFILTLDVPVHASPSWASRPLATGAGHRRQLSPTPSSSSSALTPVSSTPSVSSPSSASISDGGGTDYSPVSISWIVFSILLALPLLTAGVRGYKLTSGTGIGLSLSLLIWVIFVNSTTSGTSLASSQNSSDLFLSLAIWGVFAVGCLGAFVRVGVLIGINLLGACAGGALGILLVCLRPGLLVPIYAINIIPLAFLALAGFLWPLWHQRLAVVCPRTIPYAHSSRTIQIVSTSTIGAFFLALSIDLSLNKQSGLSEGLRFLLDRNKAHITITLQTGYHPPLSTIIIIGTCILLIPAFSYIQHRVYKGPFDRSSKSLEEWNILVKGAPIIGPGDEGFVSKDGLTDVEEKKPKVRFPSIIPSLPGNIPAPLPTKGNKGRVAAGAAGGVEIGGIVSPIYLAQQAAFQANPPIPMQTAPGPGIGRLGFVGYWTGVGATIAKRVSRRFSGGAGKRFSQMSAPSVYSVDVNGVGANGNTNGARGWGWRPQQQQQQSQSNQIMQGYQQQGYQSQQANMYAPNRDETPGSVYGGVQIPQTRPLQLPNRAAATTSGRPRGPPPSAYAPSAYSAPSVKAQSVKAPPAVSLRTGRWNDMPVTPISPQRVQTRAPISPQSQRQPAAYSQGQANSSTTRQQILLPSQQASSSQRTQQQSQARIQQQQQQFQGQSPPGNRNRLKSSTRHNLL